MQMLYQAHSGLRYLVLLVGLLAVLALVHAVVSRRTTGASRGLAAAFTGLLDLQILLGLALVIGGLFRGAVIGHLTMMLLAAGAAHGTSVMARRTAEEPRASTMRLAGIVVALALIALGIIAIGRSIFGAAAMTA